jgi:Flp pilus assembly pilin Flp
MSNHIEGVKDMFYLLMNLLPKDEKGQDLSEYAMLIGLIAIIVLVAVEALGGNLLGVFQGLADEVGTWFTGTGT